ncbi:hypothetical protein Tco_0668898 [Tanacetum coccineum]
MLGKPRRNPHRGYQFLRSRLISWQCKKQTIVATSTTEAEYVAAASCCRQVLWIQNQMLDYGFNFMNTKIHIDNESTICIVKNLVYHSKTKHIEIRHHFIRDSYEKKLIRVEKIHTDFNVADLLTKAFNAKFNFYCSYWLYLDCMEDWSMTEVDKVNYGIVNIKSLGVVEPKTESKPQLISPTITTFLLQFQRMASMKYYDKHNQVGFVKKPAESAGFAEIIDFLKGSHIRYTLTHNPTIHDSLVKQFWQTTTASTLTDGTLELRVTIDTLEYTITEASIQSKLQLADASGISMLPNTEIFEGMGNMGYPADVEDQQSSSAPLPSSSHPPVISATLASKPTPVDEPTTHHLSPSPEHDDEQTEHIFEQPSPEHQPLLPRQETEVP